MDPHRRRALGAHYTAERDILRLLRPLVLDGLEAELAACGPSPERLHAFRAGLGRLTFLDPACGCGDFLAVAHRELRRLEDEALLRLGVRDAPVVSADQFHGIEIDADAARRAPGRIVVGNALRTPWPRCSFVIGNPPYVGKHLLSDAQRADLAGLPGSLDYAAGWLLRAAEHGAPGAFVLTNSVTQGEQVPALWPLLHARGLRVSFAQPPFAWGGDANVHVVIVGFERGPARAGALNGYLAPGPEVYPAARARPLAPSVPPVVYGAKPADGGALLLAPEEVRALDPVAAAYVRPMLTAAGFLNGRDRYCLWLDGADPEDVERSPALRERLARVRAFRLASPKAHTRAMAARPGLFAEVRRPGGDFIFVPRHASAARALIPMGLVTSDAVVHDSGAYVESADLELFGVLQSAMFAAWQRTVGGRIKSDYRFNNRLVYNTFPFPAATSAVGEAAHDVIAARAGGSPAELYARLPRALARAHERLDAAVDAAFGHPPGADRLATLFERYAGTLR